MRVVAVGMACFLAGLAIGAGAMTMAGEQDESAPPASRARHEFTADDRVDQRSGHLLVFLVDGVTHSERQGIEAALAAREDVEAYEHWDAEASLAEARRLFRDDPEMIAKFDDGLAVPESYRLLLRNPTRPNATVVWSHFEGLPGVLEVVITDNVPGLGE